LPRERNKTMNPFEKIKALLEEKGVEYFTKEHPNEPNGSEKAMGFDPEQTPHHEGAKAIVLKGKKTKQFYHFVLPDDLRLDQKKVKELVGEKVSFASAEEVIAETGCIPGSVPPFGSAIGMKTRVDSKFDKDKEIFFNAGSLTNSIRMQYKDYILAEQPVEVDVTE